MSEISPKPKRLPVLKVLSGAFLLPLHDWRRFAGALAVPLISQIIIDLAREYTSATLDSWEQWLLWGVSIAIYIVLAVRCHRLVLLGPQDIPTWSLPRWSWRETKFACYLAGIYAVLCGLTYAMAWLTEVIRLNMSLGISVFVSYVGVAAYLYLPSRVLLALPAEAIGSPIGVRGAWEVSRRNGWRLCVVTVLLPNLAEAAGDKLFLLAPGLAMDLVFQVFAMAVIIVEVAALSLAFRELCAIKEDAAGEN